MNKDKVKLYTIKMKLEYHSMLKELADNENRSMSNYIHNMIKKEYDKLNER